MDKQKALKIIMTVSFVGICFSGVLTYRELFLESCRLGPISCGVNTGPIFGISACALGLIMYLFVFVVSYLGYKSEN